MGSVDIHCHILAAIDDGSPDMSTSVAMARLAVAANISTAIATPHWVEFEHETDPGVVRRAVADLQRELDRLSIALSVLPGNEAFVCPDLPDRVSKGDVLTIADRRTHLLVELPYEELPAYVDDVVFRLQLRGITPVLAHVERYAYVRQDWRLLERWVRHGCLAQVNAASLDGDRPDHVAQDLVAHKLIACTATDAHDVHHRAPRPIWNEQEISVLKEEQ